MNTKNTLEKYAGRYSEYHYCQYFFDPRGSKVSSNIAEFTKAERDFLEDKLIHCHDNNPGDKVIALI